MNKKASIDELEQLHRADSLLRDMELTIGKIRRCVKAEKPCVPFIVTELVDQAVSLNIVAGKLALIEEQKNRRRRR